MDNKMTVFYKKKSKEIDAICGGEQDLEFYSDIDPDVREIVYDFLIVDYDQYILRNKMFFEIIENEDTTLSIKMKIEYQETLRQYIE